MPENQRPRILIAEDEIHTRNLLRKILSNQGFDITVVEDGEEGLATVRSGPQFDLIISDWMMPKMDGLEFCRRVKADTNLRKIYFIVLSSRDLPEDKVNALNTGIDDYISKPCNPDELTARIRVGLRIRDLQNEILKLERKMAVLQIATTAGHEINNPLTSVIGYIGLLREGIESGEPRETLMRYMVPLSEQADRIRDVVSRLISLSDIHIKPYLGKQTMIDLGIGDPPDSTPSP
jgi:sigma-B regulation protein RsbU (phosphoserine phosphatase)